MWWEYIVAVVVLILAVAAFVSIVRFQTRNLSRKTNRTVDSMYDSYADSPRQQRRFARRRGGSWRDEE
jgi:hypothetical protein